MCWQELCNFHNFYLKIEKAHTNLRVLINTEVLAEDVSKAKRDHLLEQIVDSRESSQLEHETLFIKEENPLEIYEDEEVEEVKTNKRKLALRNSTNDKKINLKNTSKKRCKKENFATEIRRNESNENQIEDGIKLEDIEYDCKETKLNENFNNPNDAFESGDDSSPNYADASKLEQLHQEQDKFISENFQITCSYCDIPLETCDIMAKHYKEEHNQRGYATCCDVKLYTRSKILHHIRLHKNPEDFKCKQCDKILNNPYSLQNHIKNVHGSKQFECSTCFKVLSNASSLRAHKLIHDADKRKTFSCKECDKSYLRKHSLDNHIRFVHLKKHIICDLCGKSIKDNCTFNRHMLEHEGKAKSKVKVTCEVCGLILSDRGCLSRHIRSKHPPGGVKREFKCTQCTKIFTSNTNLKNHVWGVHEKKYERKCALCEKTFNGPGALRDHMSQHTGKPLLACGFCPKEFYSNSNMYAHRKKAHPNEWKESLQKKKYYHENILEKE